MIEATYPTRAHDWKRRARLVARILLGLFFIGAGMNHFRNAQFYQQIVPPGFGSPALIVILSGIAEIVGGVGVLIPPLRRTAGWGLIALLIAVFPANIYMAIEPQRFPQIPQWALWLRLPLQLVLIAWVWFASLQRAAEYRH